ncbi:MAG: single-stranded DNA-binding protein [bacterium]
MANINEVTLLGIVVDEPNLRYTPQGHALWHCLMAVNRPGAKYKEDEDKKADYLHVIVWGDEAERCNEHVQQGSQIAVLGRLQSRNYNKVNEPTPQQFDKVLELFSTLAVDEPQELVNEALDILELDGRKTSHTAYEVSARKVEFLNNCIFEEEEEE